MPNPMYKRKRSSQGTSQGPFKRTKADYGGAMISRYGNRRRSWKGLYMGPRIHRFTRMNETTFTLTAGGGFSDGVATNQSLQMEFSLNAVQYYLGGAVSTAQSLNPAELTTLFDQYRIDAIEIKIMATGDPNTFTATGTLPRFYICNDYDDAGALGSLAQVQQQQGVKIFQPGAIDKSYTHWVRPKLLTQTYRTAVTTGYAPAQSAVWVDCTQSDVPHYGVKIWNTGSGVAATVTFSIRAYISVKNQC